MVPGTDFQLVEVREVDIGRSVFEWSDKSAKYEPSEGLTSWNKLGRFAHIVACTLQQGLLVSFYKQDIELRLISFSE
jgi:hypothetical protein